MSANYFFSGTPIFLKLCIVTWYYGRYVLKKFHEIPFTNEKFSLIKTFFVNRCPDFCPNSKMSGFVFTINVRISVTYEYVRICVQSYTLLITSGRRPPLNASILNYTKLQRLQLVMCVLKLVVFRYSNGQWTSYGHPIFTLMQKILRHNLWLILH